MFAIIDTGTSVPCSEAMRRSRGVAKLAAAESRFLYLRALKKNEVETGIPRHSKPFEKEKEPEKERKKEICDLTARS